MKRSLRKVWSQYVEHEIAVVSAALAYHTILAVVPVLGLGFWYLQRIGVTKQWILLTRQHILEHLNVGSSTVFLKHFDSLTTKVQGMSWGWIGFSVLLYTSISLLAKLGRGLDFMMNESSEVKGDWQQKLLVWCRRGLGLVGLPIALTLSVVISQEVFKQKQLAPLIGRPVSWGATIISVFFVYYFIPTKRVGVRPALKLALFVGPLLELLRVLFGWYSKQVVLGQKVYGVFAVIPLLILWIQLSWALLLSGALWLKKKR